ncbi:2-oxo acid dehydrogenase subunit E2 [Microaerobacter geothermalis]|uniref:dihydrolipoamide acetyltransferase family protein n=1 Tax=Microaerobacter geothermalis TaxID=674972 RepID=UPI001F16B694|nr:dihydrolipoamide acetyltransferase family protein [Microaerobacter geothermalis]MCF6092925.1 2-oxo acid dehydrogenase subunit E2 [Microaerobacter geothermalis]
MGLFQFKLPDIGEGIHEGEIVKWHVKPGDEIEEDQVILEVQNDKATVEIPSPVGGKVKEVLVDEGTIAEVGDVLITFEVKGEAVAKENDTASVVQNEAEEKTTLSKERVAETADTRKILATPSVRKYAREKGVDLAKVNGTGRHGQITREDIETFLSGAQGDNVAEDKGAEEQAVNVSTAKGKDAVNRTVQAVPDALPFVEAVGRFEERVPLKGIRKVIASAMTKSMYTAPHVTLMDEADVSKLVALRQKAKPIAEKKGIKLTYLPFIAKALVVGAKQFPAINASIDDEKQEIVYKKYYHIGIATDTENGLIVPVVTNADRKNIWTIASEIADLAKRGREGKLAPHELKGSTLTISNIGSAGGLFFTPVINWPEAAILGVGRISEKPVVKNGEITTASVMALSLSFDHRLIDGVTGQQFMNYIKQLLEDPQLLVMEV